MIKNTYNNKVVWIIGASSGIGEALSKDLASKGAILCLSARRAPELEKLKSCLSGTKHENFSLDICDAEAVIKTVNAIHAHFGRIDSIVFLAAAYKPMKLESLDIHDVRQIIETNLLGAFYVLHAVVPLLKSQSYGQIALCGSVAGYMGLPGGQPYSATKAGIINLAESLRAELPSTIDVKIINPGFVQTDLTAKNNFEMPMMITAEKAATFIADGLLTKDFEIHFPKKFTLCLKLLHSFPYWLSIKILAQVNLRKKSSC